MDKSTDPALTDPGRRRLLATGATSSLAMLSGCASPGGAHGPAASRPSPSNVRSRSDSDAAFALGVASGEPAPDGVVLWTRLEAVGSADAVFDDPVSPRAVRWEIAEDEAFRRVVKRGETTAVAELGYSVHVWADGLKPGRWYWYRFHTGRGAKACTSAVGRTRTAEAADALNTPVRFAFASCQQYEQGYYGAYRSMLGESVDLVVFVGDYIYESSWGRNHVRSHGAPVPHDLPAYRQRYALYKRDPDLRAMHAAAPWLITWDDHEVQNDYAGTQGEDLAPGFVQRRAAAYQAWSEHQPVRSMVGVAARLRAGAKIDWRSVRIYRRLPFSPLANFLVLDDRQYRSPQVCPRPGRGGGRMVDTAECADFLAPGRTLLGAEQERWLSRQLRQADARWNIVVQQTLFSRADRDAGPATRWSTDAWDGYPLSRQRLVDELVASHVANPLIVGGDVHANWVCDVKADFDRPDSRTVATEFCGTSITSQGGTASRYEAAMRANPWVKLADGTRRGYCVMQLQPRTARCTLRVIDNEKIPDPRLSTLASFVVEDGRAGAIRA